MNDNSKFIILGEIKVSPIRTKTLKAIGDKKKIPSEIAKELDIRTNQVSSALSFMKKKGLVVCINEESKKGRLYQCTPLGLEILEFLNE